MLLQPSLFVLSQKEWYLDPPPKVTSIHRNLQFATSQHPGARGIDPYNVQCQEACSTWDRLSALRWPLKKGHTTGDPVGDKNIEN